jgi:hypothetical protein
MPCGRQESWPTARLTNHYVGKKVESDPAGDINGTMSRLEVLDLDDPIVTRLGEHCLVISVPEKTEMVGIIPKIFMELFPDMTSLFSMT